MAGSGRKILVVDDDPWIAKMLEFVVSDAGHTAVVCKDGNDALEKFASVMPDLVLLDVVLPKLDGLKVCEHIKKSPIGRLTPVLLFSGIYRDSTEALKFGADAFLAKPFTPQQIGQQIKQLLPLLPEPPAADLAAPPLKFGPSETPLSQEPLPKALGRFFQAHATGVLTLRSRVGIKYLFLEKGNVVQVRSPATAAGVTTSLLARGKVTAGQLEELEKKARESGGKKNLSQLLVETNLVRADDLRKLVLSQMLWEIFEVFRWREGGHAFAEGPPLPAGAGQFKLDVQAPNLIQWGVRKMDPKPEDLDHLVPSRMTFLARRPDTEEHLKPLQLTERERSIVQLIDGTKTLQEIVSIADLAGTDAVPVLYTLLCTGVVVSSAPVSTSAPKFQGPDSPNLTSTARALPGPFALAVMELWRNRETGVLRCVGPLDNRTVYVSRGVPVFARSERNADRLDQMLVRQAAITPDQAARSLELQGKTPHKRIGQILLEMNAITLEHLHATVKTQVQNLVLSLFTWSDGKYMFEPGALPTQEAITLDWDTPGAVLQGLRGLPLNYIRPLAPPKDAIIERAPESGILAELQLNSAEQKLLALLVGRHPMQQLLALDFIANESLLRGLVTFAALGLITVHPGASRLEISDEAGDDDETIDPLDRRPPAYVKAPVIATESAPYVPRKGPTLDNSWPDPTPIAPKKQKFTPGPALAAFEAEESLPPPATSQTETQNENPNPSAEAGVFQFAPPEETGSAPAAAEDSFAAAQAALAAWSAQQERAPAVETVPRALYEAISAEKQELQQRLLAVLEERNASDRVPRELFDQVQAEKRQVQEKMMLMLDELLRLRQQPKEQDKEERGTNVHPFPGSRKNE
jgi:CheY-like chemotaxis protein